MAENGTKKLEKNTTTGMHSGKIERRTVVILVSEGEENEGRGRRGGGGGQQEVAVSFINLVRKKHDKTYYVISKKIFMCSAAGLTVNFSLHVKTDFKRQTCKSHFDINFRSLQKKDD